MEKCALLGDIYLIQNSPAVKKVWPQKGHCEKKHVKSSQEMAVMVG